MRNSTTTRQQAAAAARTAIEAARDAINFGPEIPSGLHRRFLLHLNRAEDILEKVACGSHDEEKG